ncbi:MAG: CBS domain-containing protein, partial [Acidobacteria bacterium]|nr:CBS domain-containing protein [Acidobacteriota bacterium]
PDASVLDAARLMKAHHVGDLVVVKEPDGHRMPVGIITDRDIALALVEGRGSKTPCSCSS